MSDQLSIEEFATEIKKRRPDLASIPNDVLVGKTLSAAPELKQFVNLDISHDAAHTGAETGVFGSLFSNLGVQKQDQAFPTQGGLMSPAVDAALSKPSVASEGAAQALVGMGHAVKGAPGGTLQLLKAALPMVTGNSQPMQQIVNSLYEQGKQIVSPMFSQPSPESPEWQQAQQGAGASLIAAESPNLIEGGIAGTSKLAKALTNYLPSETRAGAVLNTIKTAAANEPISTTAAMPKINQSIADALAERATGGGRLSEGMNMFRGRQQPITGNFMGAKVQMAPDPINFPESFRFASNAKRISSLERQNMGGVMKAQQNTFARALQEGNREIAVRIGMGEEFDAAMREYRNAKILGSTTEALAEVLKNRAVQTGIGTGLGYGLYRAVGGKP